MPSRMAPIRSIKVGLKTLMIETIFRKGENRSHGKEMGTAVIGYSLNLPRPKIMRYALHSIELNGRRTASEKSSLNKMNVCLKKIA